MVILAIGLLLIGWLLNTPEGLLGKADALGYAVCHRISVRSFHIGERSLPLCARCSGMYLGAMLGLAYQAVRYPRRGGMPPIRVWALLGIFVAAFGIDGLNSYLHLFPGAPGVYEPQNWLRLLTGTGMGLAVATAMYPAFNQTVWRHWDIRPAFPDLRSFLPLTGLALVLVGLTLLGSDLILYPLAIISAAGVLVLLTMVYCMVLLLIFRQENRYEHFSQLWFPLLSGFGVALLQIAVLDAIRFFLTGSWDGFHLG